MASNHKHIINKYQFDVVLQKEKDFSKISQSLTQLFYRELQHEIDRIFSDQSIPSELIFSINQIEIDLGEISIENLEKEFKLKFVKELSQSIRQAILFKTVDSKRTIRIQSRELELIRFYLRLGTLPWWSSILMKSLDSVFRNLIFSETNAVKQLVFEEAIYPIPRRRIINQFKDPTIYALFGIISSEPADYYKDYTDNLITLHQHSRITNEGDIKYKKVVQELTFIYLLDQKGTSINQYEFFKKQIKSLAVKYDFDYYDLVKQIFFSSQEIFGVKDNSRKPIATLAKSLYEEEVLLDRHRVNPEEKLRLSQKIIEELFTRGTSAIPLKKLGFSNRDEVFQWLAESAPNPFVTRYRALGKEWMVRERTITLFDDSSLGILFEKAAPQIKPLVFEVFEIFENIQDSITPINQEKIAFKKVIRHFALELLVFQNLNTITDEGYFQKQLQMYSNKYNISEIEILTLLNEEIEKLKKYKRGYKVIKKIIGQSKERIINQQEEDDSTILRRVEISKLFLALKKNYSSEIYERIKKRLNKYIKVYSPELKDQTNIYLFVAHQLEKLTGEDFREILERRLEGIDDKVKRETLEKALFEKTIGEANRGYERIEYLIERLKETPLKEWIIQQGKKNPKNILIELIFERGKDLAAFVIQQKYDVHFSKIISKHVDWVEFRTLIKQFELKNSNKILEFLENILMIQERWKIGRIAKNHFEIFLKEQVIRFILTGNQKGVEIFVLDQMKQKGLINYKNLTLFRDYFDFSEEFWSIQSAADLILDSSVLRRQTIKSIQQIYLQDLILHYLAEGSIPLWVEKDLYGVETIRLFFNLKIKETNVTFAHKLSQVLIGQSYNSRIFELVEKGMEDQFFKWLERAPGHYNITNVIAQIQQFFQINDLKEFDKILFEAIIKYKIWLIPDKKTRIAILQHSLLEKGFKVTSEELIKDEWLFVYEILFGEFKDETDLEGNQRKILEKIQKHPLRFFELIKKIPDPENQMAKIFKQIPRHILIRWFLTVLEKGNFPVRVKNYGILSINYFKAHPQNKYLERYITFFIVQLLFSEPVQSQRIRRFFEKIASFPKEMVSEIIGIFYKSMSTEKKSIWQYYSRQISKENTYQLPERLKQEWVLVLHFLQYGSIPFTGKKALSKDQIRLILLRLLAEAPSFMKNKLYRLLRETTTRRTFSSLLKQEDVAKILKLIHPNLERDWNQLSELVQKSKMEQSLAKALGWLNWKDELGAILYTWVKGNYFLSGTAEIIVPVIKTYSKKEKIEPNVLIGLIGAKKENADVEIVKEIRSFLKTELKQEKEANQERLMREEGEEVDKSGISINNAGLSLLWPFLGRFFKRLNMIKDGDFISEEVRMRGVQLTQYLVTGKTEIEESELTLNRLLCGAEKDLVIEYDLDITEEEIALSESLLQGVIYNWEKMRGTRPDTFRQTFLQRAGILSMVEDHYELKVEEKSYDMLLTTLPWNLSMIKLAWMKSRLTVIWK